LDGWLHAQRGMVPHAYIAPQAWNPAYPPSLRSKPDGFHVHRDSQETPHVKIVQTAGRALVVVRQIDASGAVILNPSAI
jgi:hypothetical protein